MKLSLPESRSTVGFVVEIVEALQEIEIVPVSYAVTDLWLEVLWRLGHGYKSAAIAEHFGIGDHTLSVRMRAARMPDIARCRWLVTAVAVMRWSEHVRTIEEIGCRLGTTGQYLSAIFPRAVGVGFRDARDQGLTDGDVVRLWAGIHCEQAQCGAAPGSFRETFRR